MCRIVMHVVGYWWPDAKRIASDHYESLWFELHKQLCLKIIICCAVEQLCWAKVWGFHPAEVQERAEHVLMGRQLFAAVLSQGRGRVAHQWVWRGVSREELHRGHLCGGGWLGSCPGLKGHSCTKVLASTQAPKIVATENGHTASTTRSYNTKHNLIVSRLCLRIRVGLCGAKHRAQLFFKPCAPLKAASQACSHTWASTVSAQAPLLDSVCK